MQGYLMFLTFTLPAFLGSNAVPIPCGPCGPSNGTGSSFLSMPLLASNAAPVASASNLCSSASTTAPTPTVPSVASNSTSASSAPPLFTSVGNVASTSGFVSASPPSSGSISVMVSTSVVVVTSTMTVSATGTASGPASSPTPISPSLFSSILAPSLSMSVTDLSSSAPALASTITVGNVASAASSSAFAPSAPLISSSPVTNGTAVTSQISSATFPPTPAPTSSAGVATPSASIAGISLPLTPSASASGSTNETATTTGSAATPSGSGSANSTSSPSGPSSGGMVIAHFMVGNSAPYTAANWASDIKLASSKGLDGFVLNLGSDAFQPDQVANAFSAAQAAGTSFRIGFSFDMTAMPCAAAGDAALLQSYLTKYGTHPNVMQFDGKMFVSTFSGETCTFGAGSVDAGWQSTVKGSGMPAVHFVPSFFVDPSTFGSYQSIDGMFNWNAGWPQAQGANASFESDTAYISGLGGKTYLAPVSPWFFTHYGPDTYNKNWIYNFDNWLFSERWELLVQNRDKAPIVEVITWNDYGESHYVGPIGGSQPNSQAWVNGFDHQGWLDIMQYYIQYYKSGTPPTISEDRIFLWAKLFATSAAAANDPVGPPKDAAWASDTLWAQFHLTQPADLTLTCGDTMQTFPNVEAGVSKQKLALTGDCSMSAEIARGGSATMSLKPQGMDFSTSPQTYNFNAFVAASPAS